MKKTGKSQLGDLYTLLRLYRSARNGDNGGMTGRAWRQGRRFKVQTSTWVCVPPETAFAYVADITQHNDWATDEIRVTQLTPGPVHLGTEYSSVGIQGGKEWPSHLVVTGFEPPRRFEFTASGGPIPAPDDDPHRHEFLFIPENGGTRIEVCKTDPAPDNMPSLLVWIMTPIAKMTLGNRYLVMRNLQACLDRLAEKDRPQEMAA